MTTTQHIELISSEKLAEIFLLKDNRQIDYNVKNGNLPTPVKFENSQGFRVEEINELFGIDIAKADFVDKTECCKILGITLINLDTRIQKKEILYFKLSATKGSKILFDRGYLMMLKDEFSFDIVTGVNTVRHNSLLPLVEAFFDATLVDNSLTARERDVLQKFHFEGWSLEQIGEARSMAREVVRQTKEMGIRKLRKTPGRFQSVYAQNKELREEIEQLKKENSGLRYKCKVTLDLVREEIREEIMGKIPNSNSILGVNIRDLDLSVRALNCLKAAEIDVLGELVHYKRSDLLKFRNFGKKGIDEVEALLKSMNLEFAPERRR